MHYSTVSNLKRAVKDTRRAKQNLKTDSERAKQSRCIERTFPNVQIPPPFLPQPQARSHGSSILPPSPLLARFRPSQRPFLGYRAPPLFLDLNTPPHTSPACLRDARPR